MLVLLGVSRSALAPRQGGPPSLDPRKRRQLRSDRSPSPRRGRRPDEARPLRGLPEVSGRARGALAGGAGSAEARALAVRSGPARASSRHEAIKPSRENLARFLVSPIRPPGPEARGAGLPEALPLAPGALAGRPPGPDGRRRRLAVAIAGRAFASALAYRRGVVIRGHDRGARVLGGPARARGLPSQREME